jgi:uncharacterized protein
MLLRNKDKQILISIFSVLKIPVEVWAYGSRVTGEAHEGSDLDLVIRMSDQKKLTVDTFLELKDKIRESNIPILVELFDWARLPESFHRNIECYHEILFSNITPSLNDPNEEYKKADDLH